MSDGRGAMSDNDEIRRLHAGLEALAAEVARLRERLDDRDLDQAARDDALNRALSSEPDAKPRPWKLLFGGADVAAAGAALVQRTALIAVTGALDGALSLLCREDLKAPAWQAGSTLCHARARSPATTEPGIAATGEPLPPARPAESPAGFAKRAGGVFYSGTDTCRTGYKPICSCRLTGSAAVR